MFYVLFPLRPESFRKIWRCQVQGWRRIWLYSTVDLHPGWTWTWTYMDPVDMICQLIYSDMIWWGNISQQPNIPSGKRLHNYGKSPFSMGKSTISMAIFNSYVSLPGRVYPMNIPLNHYKSHEITINHYQFIIISCKYPPSRHGPKKPAEGSRRVKKSGDLTTSDASRDPKSKTRCQNLIVIYSALMEFIVIQWDINTGWWFQTCFFSIIYIYGLSSFPLANIFQRGRYTTNQMSAQM